MPDSPEKEAVKEALKNSKYASLKPTFNLTENQKIKLAEVIKVCPGLAEMHQQKESVRNIFQDVNDWESGLNKIVKWPKVAKLRLKSMGICPQLNATLDS